MVRKEFHLHGDNIVECERVFALIRAGHQPSYECTGPAGSPTNPRFSLQSSDECLDFVFFPGFGRWEQNILEYISSWPGALREAADSIITVLQDDLEKPLAAVEYCSALAAGNNAWQRCGRAYSFAKAGIPYFYLTDIGGYELDGERKQRARRYPNVAVPLSYVALSLRSNVVALPVFECNPSADMGFRAHFGPALNEGTLERLLFAILHEKQTKRLEEKLEEKAIRFIELLQIRPDRQNETTDDLKTRRVYYVLKQGKPFSDFLKSGNATSWRKSITIPLTKTASKFLELGSKYGKGVTRSSLPISFIPASDRRAFAEDVSRLYDDLPKPLKSWLKLQDDLAICWIAGFKPRGDDSRPDRGLVPLCRMLFGDAIHVLSFVYGPGKVDMWRLLKNDPTGLIQKNGLWEALLKLSDAVLMDATTNKGVTERGYTKEHWKKSYALSQPQIKCISEQPVEYGENDVDSALHNILCHLMAEYTFEGMCNPPGGDWSGISILNPKRSVEHRWLTLPRVSGPMTKRPDHVFQFFLIGESPFIFSVESKEVARAVENNIGPHLEKYLINLFKKAPNVQRDFPSGQWKAHEGNKITIGMPMATGVAFLSEDVGEIAATLQKAKADVALGLAFAEKGMICMLRGRAATRSGMIILNIIEKVLATRKSPYHFVSA
jgi:hypothetical protein